MKVYAIIPAGGQGKRVGSQTPKQYIQINGKELIVYTLEVFQKCAAINEIVVAAEKEYFDLLNLIKRQYNIDKLKTIVEGGKERQQSVANALNNIDADRHDLIAVHDAVRPLLPSKVLQNAVTSAKKNSNAVVAVKAKDTLVNFDNNIMDYLDRRNVYYIQTPQIFSYEILKHALDKAEHDNFTATDESMLVKRCGVNINIVEGSGLNFKITTESDLELFHLINVK